MKVFFKGLLIFVFVLPIVAIPLVFTLLLLLIESILHKFALTSEIGDVVMYFRVWFDALIGRVLHLDEIVEWGNKE